MLQYWFNFWNKKMTGGLLLGALCILPILPGNLQAQFTCSGSGCSYLPFSQSDLNSMLYELQTQYTDKLFDDMAEAAVLANLTGAPMGSINLQRFTFGVSVGLGVVPPHDVTVNVPGVADFDDVPVAGAAVTPRLFAGVNLGWLMGMGYDPYAGKRKKTPFFLSPARFDIYVTASDGAYEQDATTDSPGSFSANIYHRGVELRYHLVEGKSLVGGPGVRFLGVSTSVGMSRTRQDFTYNDDADDITMTVESGTQVVWGGDNRIQWKTEIDVYNLEVRTGIQLMYFFNLSLGMGTAQSKGSSSFLMSRIGQAYVKSDLLTALGATLPDAYLSMSIIGDGRVPKNVPYFKLGLDINILAFKITMEGMTARNSHGFNAAVRLQF